MLIDQQKKETRLLSIALLLIISISLITSLFFKEKWLWMDEVLSYMLISDPSIAHLNDAVVSGMDANPPLFANVYWFIGHGISLNPQFLRAVSIVIFAVTIALFYRYTTRLVGNAILNFLLISVIVSLTYLNFTLSTQIRTYSLFLLISLGYFVALQMLITEPVSVWAGQSSQLQAQPIQTQPSPIGTLFAFLILGLLLMFTHSFGLFYVAASGAFCLGLLIWSSDRRYVALLLAHGLILLVWLLAWYPKFAIQSEAGKPHSWIPLPTFTSFFDIAGELAPSPSSSLERKPLFQFLPILRFLLLVGLWLYIALPRLKNARFQVLIRDKAFMFFLLAGFLYVTTLSVTVLVSLFFRSIFISRYLWPSHLLVMYLLVYAFYFFRSRWQVRSPNLAVVWRLIPVYMLLLAGFIFYQNRKVNHFPSGVLSYLPQLDKRYPVFVETADYFLPIWFHDKSTKIRYLLDWQTANTKDNILSATVEHNILKSVREKYHVNDILTAQDFNRVTVPHFYVIDESSHYQIEHFIENGRIRVIRQLPIGIKGHRILECTLRS